MEQAKMGLDFELCNYVNEKNFGNPDCDLDSKPSMESRNEAND